MHTVLAPILTGGLYLFVFGEALSKHLPVYEGRVLYGLHHFRASS